MTRPSFTVNELRDNVAVDRYNLEEAAERQPVLYQAVAEAHGHAYKLLAKARVEYDRVKGTAYFRVRKELDEAGTKVTDSTAEMALRKDPEFLSAKLAQEELEAMTEDLKNLIFAYQQRGRSIEMLQEQLKSGFYMYRTATATR